MSDAEKAELQEALQGYQVRAAYQQQVFNFMDKCFDVCVDKLKDHLDSKQEACMCNCVERYIDTGKLIEQRLAARGRQMMQ